LEVLITLDDPGDLPEEDTFHLRPKNTPKIEHNEGFNENVIEPAYLEAVRPSGSLSAIAGSNIWFGCALETEAELMLSGCL